MGSTPIFELELSFGDEFNVWGEIVCSISELDASKSGSA
jgi:hypothetical protein